MTQRPNPHRSACGFTLVELLVVVAIIALLIAILLPALDKAREVTKTVVCLTKLHSIGVAISGYIGENGGYYPSPGVLGVDPTVDSYPGAPHTGLSGGYTWTEALLPYLYPNMQPPVGDPAVIEASQKLAGVYGCPADPNRPHSDGLVPKSFAMNGQRGNGATNGGRFDGLFRYPGSPLNLPEGATTQLHNREVSVQQPSDFWTTADGNKDNYGFAHVSSVYHMFPKPNYDSGTYFAATGFTYISPHLDHTNNWLFADVHASTLRTEDTIGKGTMGVAAGGSWTKTSDD